MHPSTRQGFLDEFKKIAIAQALGRAALSGRRVAKGSLTSASHIARRARRLEDAARFRIVREQRRHAELADLIRAGGFDPKKHSMREFMRSGKVAPRPMAAPWKPPSDTITKPSERATAAVDKPTGITKTEPRKTTTVIAVPPSVPAPTLSSAVSIPLTPRQKAGIVFGSLGALGGAGAGGYHIGDPG